MNTSVHAEGDLELPSVGDDAPTTTPPNENEMEANAESIQDIAAANWDDLDNDESVAASQADVTNLLRLADARAEESHNAYLRALAEMENLRKRTTKEVDQARKFALEGFTRDLLAVADNMDRAIAAIPSTGDAAFQAVASGVRMVQTELNRVMTKHGVTRVNAINTRFDPNLHQAIMQVDDPKAEPGTVVQELQAGYLLHDRLLRPAMVGVTPTE